MKIRQGFVSNSSSSSFILKMERAPKDLEDFKSMLVLDSEYDYYGNQVSQSSVINYIFRQLKNESASLKEILDEVTGSIPEIPSAYGIAEEAAEKIYQQKYGHCHYKNLNSRPLFNPIFDEEMKKAKKITEIGEKKFAKRFYNKKDFYAIIEASDDSKVGGIIEQEGCTIFSKMKDYIQINNH